MSRKVNTKRARLSIVRRSLHVQCQLSVYYIRRLSEQRQWQEQTDGDQNVLRDVMLDQEGEIEPRDTDTAHTTQHCLLPGCDKMMAIDSTRTYKTPEVSQFSWCNQKIKNSRTC